MAPSRQLGLTCLSLVIGAVIGSYFNLSLLLCGLLSLMWLVVAISGQDEPLQLVALALFGLTAGAFLWQATGGETWLNLAVIGKIGGLLASWRDAIVNRISLALPEPQGSLMSGILLGNRVKLDSDLINTFRAVGLTHIIAVSGYNLTILTANVVTIFWPLIGRKSLWLSAAVIGLFVIITGAPASILRAAVMALTVILAKSLGRPSRGINVLILATTVLTLFEPKILFDVGFQLSVAATYGLIRLSPYLARLFGRTNLPNWLSQILSETFAAIIMTTPLIIGHFERLSLVSPLANLLVLPLIPLTMAIGLVAIPVVFLLPAVGNILLLASWPLLTWVVFISEKLASLPLASTDLALPAWVIIGLMATLVGGLEWLNRQRPLQTDLFERLSLSLHAS